MNSWWKTTLWEKRTYYHVKLQSLFLSEIHTEKIKATSTSLSYMNRAMLAEKRRACRPRRLQTSSLIYPKYSNILLLTILALDLFTVFWENKTWHCPWPFTVFWENKTWHFMWIMQCQIFSLKHKKDILRWYFAWIICPADDIHEMPSLIFLEKIIIKKNKMSPATILLSALSIKTW